MKRYEQGSVGMRPDPEGSWCEYEEAQAEIERLREELSHCLHLDNHNAIVANLNDQIEHMSVAIENSGSMAFAYKQEQEIERLCHELADAHGVAQACEMRAEKAEAEIERLRKLLRDGLTSNIPEWRERVREALGE